jgi:hemerythrin
MEKIIWDGKFSVCIRQIDEQHKERIRMVNKLIETKDVQVNSELISETLMKMTQYASEHFKTEENLMSEYDYPEYEKHKEQHIQFRKKTVSFSFDTMSYKEEIPNEVIEYLREWWVNHILFTDTKYKTFLPKEELTDH